MPTQRSIAVAAYVENYAGIAFASLDNLDGDDKPPVSLFMIKRTFVRLLRFRLALWGLWHPWVQLVQLVRWDLWGLWGLSQGP